WAGKLTGAVARLAGVLHCATHALTRTEWASPISEETMNRACALGVYFLGHALQAFGDMHSNRAEADARAVANWLGKGGKASVSVRDVQRALSRRFTTARAAERALATLEERGLVRRMNLPAALGPGRARSTVFAVHPTLATDTADATDRKGQLS